MHAYICAYIHTYIHTYRYDLDLPTGYGFSIPTKGNIEGYGFIESFKRSLNHTLRRLPPLLRGLSHGRLCFAYHLPGCGCRTQQQCEESCLS